MTDPSLHEVFKAIGSLTAEVAGLRRDIQHAESRAVDHTRRADEHRAVIHKRVDEMVKEVGDLKTEVALLQEDVKDTKSVTDDVKRWKLMGVGALFVTGLAASAVASMITYFWSDLVRLLRGP